MKKLEEFKVICELGRGSFGKVYKVTHEGNPYALKKIRIHDLSLKKQQSSLTEVSILKDLPHPNVIKYYSSFQERGSLYIVMEYAEGGDLHRVSISLT